MVPAYVSNPAIYITYAGASSNDYAVIAKVA